MGVSIRIKDGHYYNPAEGRGQRPREKARNIYGPDLAPFEVRMETRDGAAVWLMNTLANVTQANLQSRC